MVPKVNARTSLRIFCKGELRGAAREVPDEAEAEDAVARADAGDKTKDEDAKERGVEGGHFWRVVGGVGYRFGWVAGPVPGSFVQFLLQSVRFFLKKCQQLCRTFSGKFDPAIRLF
jgi:hypothetical protein